MPDSEPMYRRAPTTVGLASSFGAGLPLTAPGVKCHTRRTDDAFAGVNAVAALTEACCGPCRYCGQSVAARAGEGTATANRRASIQIGRRTAETFRSGSPPRLVTNATAL